MKEGGSTLSYILISKGQCFTGGLGDSPLGIIPNDSTLWTAKLESAYSLHCQAVRRLPPGGKLDLISGARASCYITLPFCHYDLQMCNSIGDCNFDPEMQEAFFHLTTWHGRKQDPEDKNRMTERLGNLNITNSRTTLESWGLEIEPAD